MIDLCGEAGNATAFLPTTWRKSSRSTQSACVEVARGSGVMGVRDSKLGERSPILLLSADAWSGFLASVRAGRLDR
ncbi:DUF397 domain-containing protein [Saccharopolyspora thermophila]|uniref:DUF397 domain-containing protein n=1 Tax=Saccharopolyspora thermophila TaxID=89367 RepID=UPI00166857DC|nr:DUF397 domain-containing protein [Saccharopolyspora subtropica]